MAEHWMQKAFAHSHGQFKAKAKKAGESTAEYAAAVTKPGSKASTKTKRQANLAKLGAKFGGHHGAKQPHPKTNPGEYDTEPHHPERTDKAKHPLGMTVHIIAGFGKHPHTMGAPHTPKSHGFGHSVANRSGSLRLSGHSGAHRIGKR